MLYSIGILMALKRGASVSFSIPFVVLFYLSLGVKKLMILILRC